MSESKEAFTYAYEVLTWLKELGIEAHAELFADGSGSLVIDKRATEKITPALCKQIEQRLHSKRWMTYDQYVRLSSCQEWHP